MIINENHNNMLKSPVRKLEGRVEIYEGSTLTLTCGCHDALKTFTIERLGEEGKFFGFGVCQKLKVSLIDKDRKIDVSTANTLEVVFGVNGDYFYPCPRFHVTEVNRDETTNELSITAYDDLIVATAYLASEMKLTTPYTLRTFVAAAAAVLGLPVDAKALEDEAFDLVFEHGANLDGTETIREVLNNIAEATQTIYYIDKDWGLTFKRLDRDGEAAITLDKENYFTLDSRTNRRLAYIYHVTDLGDNLVVSTGYSGSSAYIRNNPFWNLREDVGSLLEAALERTGGLTLNQFDCEWRGNYLLELGDKIDMVTKDNKTVTSYLLNDTLIFDGALSQHSEWSYADNDAETAANPANLGTALNQTFARVDKVNKKIELVASDVDIHSQKIGNLQVNTDNILASVTQIQKNVEIESANRDDQIEEIRKEVAAKMTAEDVKITITEELSNGVDKVATTTGFTFDKEGLTIDKTGSEMSTIITEDGMTVYRSGEAVLVANNEGVQAEDLHATTYLLIGKYSRFEDYDTNGARTGCFWVG